MKRLELKPDGWPCKLSECPPGFFLFNDSVCYKSSYGDYYVGTGGSVFWGGTTRSDDRELLIVQPLIEEWVEE